MWYFMDILHFCPFMVEDKKQKGPNSTGEIRLTLCRAVHCICSCMALRMDSDFPEGVKRIQNKMTAIFRWFMCLLLSPDCVGSNCGKRRGRERTVCSCDPTKCVKHFLLLTFYIKAGSFEQRNKCSSIELLPSSKLALAIIHERFSRNLQNICG